jgi:hypothetical protein
VGAGLALGLLGLFPAAPAWSKATLDSLYGFERTWNAALRLVRVDNNLKVTEKDESAGYFLFEYRSTESGSKTSPGSMEIIRGVNPTDPVRVSVQLPQMPHYHEQALVDALLRKLRADFGEPLRLRPTPAKREPDGGSDAGVDEKPRT